MPKRKWINRIRPSSFPQYDADYRCARCGGFPDQRTGVGGDWLIEPIRLCPGCHERVMLAVEQCGEHQDLAARVLEIAEVWPKRGDGHD